MPNKLKYSQKLADHIAALIQSGEYTITEICRLSGISRRTYYKWMEENAQFPVLIREAEKRKTEKEVVEAKRSIVKLLNGYDVVESKISSRHLKNGVERKTITLSTRHIEPDFAIIKFVLENHDKDNFSTRIHRIIKIRGRNVRNKSK